jgi:tetratricopeptide (TPR) repeat protein
MWWVERGGAAEGHQRIVALLALGGTPEELRAWALAACADLAAHCGRHREARQHYRDCLADARRLDSLPLILRSLNGLAVRAQHDGDLEESQAYHEESIAVARSADAPPAMVAGFISNYADLALLRGQHDVAQRLQEDAMQLCREAEDQAGLAWCLNHQGDIARARQPRERAAPV